MSDRELALERQARGGGERAMDDPFRAAAYLFVRVLQRQGSEMPEIRVIPETTGTTVVCIFIGAPPEWLRRHVDRVVPAAVFDAASPEPYATSRVVRGGSSVDALRKLVVMLAEQIKQRAWADIGAWELALGSPMPMPERVREPRPKEDPDDFESSSSLGPRRLPR